MRTYKDVIIELCKYYKHNLITDKVAINTFKWYIKLFTYAHLQDDELCIIEDNDTIPIDIVETLFKLLLVEKGLL